MHNQQGRLHLIGFTLILALVVGMGNWSCSSSKSMYKWGNVVPDSVMGLKPLADTSYSARVLFDIGEIRLSMKNLNLAHERHRRIKILNKEGLKYADVSIPFWHEDRFSYTKAQTILPNGEVIELSKSDIHTESIDGKHKRRKFSIPGAEVGAIIEYKYSIKTDYLSSFEPWYLQHEIPTHLSRVNYIIPEGFDYKVYTDNIDPFYRPEVYDTKLPGGWTAKELEYVFKNLEPIKKEPFMTSMNDYRKTIHFKLLNFNNSVDFNSSWQDVSWGIFPEYRKYLNGDAMLADRVQQLSNGTDKYLDWVDEMFSFVRDNISKEDFDYLYSSLDKPSAIISDKRATATEKNLLLITMLNQAGFKAEPGLLSTRSHGKIKLQIPRASAFNKLITVLSYEGSYFFMDASGEYCPREMMYPDNYGQMVFIVRKTDPEFVKLPKPSQLSKKQVAITNAELMDDGSLRFDAEVRFEGFSTLHYRKKLAVSNSHESFFADILEETFDRVKVDSISITSDEHFKQPLKINASVTIPDFAMATQDRIYMPVALLNGQEENIFKSADRHFPVDYNYQRMEMSDITIKLPEGYEVEDMPQSRKIAARGHDYMRLLAAEGNKVKIQRQLYVKETLLSSDTYESIRDFYGNVVQLDRDQIVLKKSKLGSLD